MDNACFSFLTSRFWKISTTPREMTAASPKLKWQNHPIQAKHGSHIAAIERWHLSETPLTRNRPRFGLSFPAKTFRAVDLPIPLVPTSPSTCPGLGTGNLYHVQFNAKLLKRKIHCSLQILCLSDSSALVCSSLVVKWTFTEVVLQKGTSNYRKSDCTTHSSARGQYSKSKWAQLQRQGKSSQIWKTMLEITQSKHLCSLKVLGP